MLCYNQVKKALTLFFSSTAQEEIFMKRVAYEEMVAQFTRVLEKHGFTPGGRQRRRCDFRSEQPFRRVQPRSESLSARGELPRKGRDRPACPRRVHLPHGQYGALGRPPRLRPAERTARNGACLRPRQRERRRHRGIGQQQPLDARRHLRLAGRRKGCIGICWSNTAPNMPAWGAKDCRIGNNPLILAVPAPTVSTSWWTAP